MSAKVRVNQLVKRYGPVTAVAGLSFDVRQGEVFALLGPNGAGKTTTLECVVGLRDADEGEVTVCGLDARRQMKEIKQRIGVQLQATALQDAITVREALNLFASFYRRRADPRRLLERFQLDEKADSRFETLSGGQKQRLAVALALLHEPEVLFLDEPTANLDPQSRREVHAVIRELKSEGRTVVLTTHYIEEAETLCDRVAVVDHGRIIAEGTPHELIAKSHGATRVVARVATPIPPDRLNSIDSVRSIESADNQVILSTPHPARTVIALVKLLEETNNELIDLSVRKPSLEDVFVELTGRRIRD